MRTKLGSIITEASGLIGGQQMQKSGKAIALTGRTGSNKKKSASQANRIGIFVTSSIQWNSLAPAQRLTWRNGIFKGKTGFELWKMSYHGRFLLGLPPIVSFLASDNFIEVRQIVAVAHSGTQTINISFTASIIGNIAVSIFGTRQVSAGKRARPSGYTCLNFRLNQVPATIAIGGGYTGPFGPIIIGRAIFLKFKFIQVLTGLTINEQEVRIITVL